MNDDLENRTENSLLAPFFSSLPSFLFSLSLHSYIKITLISLLVFIPPTPPTPTFSSLFTHLKKKQVENIGKKNSRAPPVCSRRRPSFLSSIYAPFSSSSSFYSCCASSCISSLIDSLRSEHCCRFFFFFLLIIDPQAFWVLLYSENFVVKRLRLHVYYLGGPQFFFLPFRLSPIYFFLLCCCCAYKTWLFLSNFHLINRQSL